MATKSQHETGQIKKSIFKVCVTGSLNLQNNTPSHLWAFRRHKTSQNILKLNAENVSLTLNTECKCHDRPTDGLMDIIITYMSSCRLTPPQT